MGIQHCSMNVKFASLLFFVGVTSATWCLEDGSNKCPGESVHGEATSVCCKGVGGDAGDKGCWLTGEKMTAAFGACCVVAWRCSTSVS